MKTFPAIVFVFIQAIVYGQGLAVYNPLSQKHIQKVEQAGTAKEKLKKYKTYYAKDSLRKLNEEAKKIRKRADSLWFLRKSMPDTLRFGLDSVALHVFALPLPDSVYMNGLPDSIPRQFQLLPDSLNKDWLTDEFKRYRQKYIPGTGADTLKEVIKSNAVELATNRVEKLHGIRELRDYDTQIKNFKPWQNEYVPQAEVLTDSAQLKAEARRKAEALATDYLAEHPEIMEGVQNKMNRLMKRFSVVPNSTDLSSARKRTSLEGKSLKERLYLAANFQVIAIKPFSVDFSPAVGYRLSTRWVAGLGAMYRKTFDGSMLGISPEAAGIRLFASYDVLANFFLYTEVAGNSVGVSNPEKPAARIWEESFLTGLGRQFLIHPKVEMTVTTAYDLLHEPGNAIYPRPWSVRVGFQLSELALLKRKPYFHR